MRILSVVSTIDLNENLGCTPAWWQLHKALHEGGNELIVTPYLGDAVTAPWWRTYDNPCYRESKLYSKISGFLDLTAGKDAGTGGLVKFLTNNWTKPKWQKHLDEIVTDEEPDVVLIFNVPLNQITGLASQLRAKHDVPVVYFDGDLPTILPEHVDSRGFLFDYYQNADLTEYDAFVVNSEGVIDQLEEMGARDVYPVHYAADPELYRPNGTPTEYDIGFFGAGASFREEHTRYMITEPARERGDWSFIVGGKGYDIDLGPVDRAGWVPINGFREFCGQSKINLNITRKGHREVYKSSTMRPFELAAMGCCIVSDPYNGLDEWFDTDRELYVAESKNEAMDLYEWLLDDDELRREFGHRARQRVVEEHTFRHRARRLESILDTYTGTTPATSETEEVEDDGEMTDSPRKPADLLD